MLINAGIRQMVCVEGYPDQLTESFLKEAGIHIEIVGDKP
jgi:deoxycytidylate deaminase